MNWTSYVIDASMGARDGLFCFCPIEGDVDGDFTVVTGMNYLSTQPPKGSKLIAIIHPDGQDAVNEFCEENKGALDRLSQVGVSQ